MPTQWDEYEAVDESPAIDWNEFEAAPVAAAVGEKFPPLTPGAELSPELRKVAAPPGMIQPQPEESFLQTITAPPSAPRFETVKGGPPVGIRPTGMQEIGEEFKTGLVGGGQIATVEEYPATIPEKVLANTINAPITAAFGEDVAAQIPRSLVNQGIGLADFMTSPLGVTTAAGGAASKAARIAAGLYFTKDLSQSVIEQAKQAGMNWQEMTPAEKADAIITFLATGAMATGVIKHTGTEIGTAVGAPIARTVEARQAMLGKPGYDLPAMAEESALMRQDPRISRVQAPLGFDQPPRGVVTAPSGVPIEAPTTLPMTRQETTRQAAIRNLNERLDRMRFKAPKPTVPEGPEIGAELTTQPTPGMREIKEPASYDEFLSDLSGKVTPDMTVRQVQELYPGTFKRGDSLVNKEAAGELLSESKKAAHPIDWMEQELEAGKRVSTNDAYDIGMKVRSIEDLERLLKYSEETQSKNKAAIAAGDVKALFKPRNMQVQIPREAVEAALGVGSAKTHPGLPVNRPLDVRFFPEAREWWKQNAKRFGEEIERKRQEEFGETETPAAEAPREPITTADLEGNPPIPGSPDAARLQAQELDAALERQADRSNRPLETAPVAEPSFLNVPRSKWTADYLEGLGPVGRAPLIRQAIAALKDVGGKTKLAENSTPQTLLKAVNEIMDLRGKQQTVKPQPISVAPVIAPPGDMVKVYHGEGGAEGAGLGGFSVTENPEYAASFGPRQSVVEVPRSVLEKMKEEARQRGEPTNLILPDEYQKQMKPVEKPIEPPITETSFITKESVEASKGNLTPDEIDELGRLLTSEEFDMLDAAQTKRLAELRNKSEAPPVPEAPAKPPEVTAPPSVPPESSAKASPAPVEPKPVTPEVAEKPAEATKVMPPGPGAASPAEFAEREIKAGNPPPVPPKDSNPGVPIDGGEIPTPEIVRKANDFGTLNRLNSGQWTFYFGRLGKAAKAAWERMALGEFRMREAIQRDVQNMIDDPLKKLPREFRREGGKAFFDVLNGRDLGAIEAEWASRPGGEQVIEQARRVKTRMEEIRTTIRDTKRESYHSYLMGMEKEVLQKLYEENIYPDTMGKDKAGMADALTLDQFPDDWGIADGSYLPHLFFGQWKLTATLPGAESPQFITRAKTPAEAKARIFELTQRNPEYRDANFTIEQDMMIPADMIRLGDGNFWRLIAQMKERSQGEMNPKEAIQGIIGKKSSKQKWFGSLQQRQGFEGYSKDYKQVMRSYLSGFHRWKELTAMNRDIQPLIDQVKREGRTNAAGRLQDIMDNLWGKPSQMSLDFDALMRDIPVLRDIVKPLALDRWARFINTTITNLTLRTVRFGVVNRLQPLQGLYPLIGEKLLVKAKMLQHSAEGKRLLDQAGVTLDVGQYASEISAVSKASKFVERITGEQSNQELAFLGMYLHGIEKGLDRAGAIRYAKLRGQLMTQFHPLVVDTPPIMEGPLGRVTFQFKRFPVKQLELLTQMAMDKNVPGLVRYFAVMSAMGGIALMLKQVYADKEKRLRVKRTLNKALGEKGADYMFYGLPGLAGADLSGSLMLGDEPFGANFPEKLGRTVMGPAPTIAYETGKAILTPAREAMSTGEKTMAIARKIPTLRQLVDLYDLVRGSTDVTSPDGETKYRRKMRDVILGMGSFRSANEANIQLAVSGAMEIEKESSKLKNALWVATQSRENGNVTSARDDIKSFNQRWPELAITPDELQKYFAYRKGNQPKTDTERALGKKYRVLMPR